MYTYDIEQLLKDGSAIRLKPQGYSMYPLFHPGRDEAVIEAYPIHLLRRGDIILYRREQGILVLHRICRITSDGFYLVGDNQTEIEGPLRPDQIRGKMTGVVRNGKSFSVSHLSGCSCAPSARFSGVSWHFFAKFLPGGKPANDRLPQKIICFRFFSFPAPFSQYSGVSSLFQRTHHLVPAAPEYRGQNRR